MSEITHADDWHQRSPQSDALHSSCIAIKAETRAHPVASSRILMCPQAQPTGVTYSSLQEGRSLASSRYTADASVFVCWLDR